MDLKRHRDFINQIKFLLQSGKEIGYKASIKRLWGHLYENIYFDIKYGINTAQWLDKIDYPNITDVNHIRRYRCYTYPQN